MASRKDHKLARKTWDRYTSNLTRGHANYQRQAQKCEDFYLGSGKQWDDDTKKELENEGRPWLESNLIFAVINSVQGYQTQTRLDIAYKPRETGDQKLADLLSKIGMHVLDQNYYPWIESQVFSDGIIMSGRGYFDIRLDFDDNMYGNINITARDPLDIIPDPDSKSYDPDDWADVIETKWMTVDDVEELYGKRKAREVSRVMPEEQDFGVGDIGAMRNKFSGRQYGDINAWMADTSGIQHVRVLERQYWKIELRDFFMDNETGDLRVVSDELSIQEKKLFMQTNDYSIVKKLTKRVRWTVATQDVVLHDDWSPYDHFTIVPYFPYFRRGLTVGLIDNLISTQEMFNKVLSQTLHVVNTTANSGWSVEENSLTNMETEDLEEIGGTTGIVIEHKKGATPPEKIRANEIPSGLMELTTMSASLISQISGVSEVFMNGGNGPETSGLAIQSRVQQNAVQLSSPLDSLYRTRHMLAQRILEYIQDFYTEKRMFNVTMADPDTGEEKQENITINDYSEEIGAYLNDTTEGKYDVVISDIPDQVTFQNSQFAQAVELRKFGIEIPDDVMILLSGLSNKVDIAKRMTGAEDPEAAARAAELEQLEIDKGKAEVNNSNAETKAKKAKAIKDSVDSAAIIVETPEVAPAAQMFVDNLGFDKEEQDIQDAQGNQEEQVQEQGDPNLGQQLSPEQQQELQAAALQQQMTGEQ